MREAGLPPLTPAPQGERRLLTGSKGVVRAVYPEEWRVDLETEDGSHLNRVQVIGPYFPELHEDGVQPSHVGYFYTRGTSDAYCWPMPARRLLGRQDVPEGASGAQPERRFFHTHHYIFRSGQVTVRITRDDRLVLETEEGDFIQLNTKLREIRLEAPSVYVGTTDATRIEYQRDDSIRALAPLLLLGTEIGDRIEYREGVEILLQAPVIKLTASESIILDPPQIKLGNENADQRLLLGDVWMAFFNTFVALFNSHQHTGVQPGSGTSGPPQTATPAMTDALLSDIARVSKTGL
jgi:hypothetical protein